MIEHLDLCSGIGGFALGFRRTGEIQTRAFCEVDPFCRTVLAKHWPGVPVFEDLNQLTAKDVLDHGIRPRVVSAGFPCQDLSIAGAGAGLDGPRSRLWFQILRVITELVGQDVAPDYVVLENVPPLRTRGLDRVLGGLAALGYDAEWHCLPAAAFGARHRRDRIWIVAYRQGDQRNGRVQHGDETRRGRFADGRDDAADAASRGRREHGDERGAAGDAGTGQPAVGGKGVAHSCGPGLSVPERGPILGTWRRVEGGAASECGWRGSASDLGRGIDGISAWLDGSWEHGVPRVGTGIPDRRKRLIALGNSLVPQIAEIIGRAVAADFHRFV